MSLLKKVVLLIIFINMSVTTAYSVTTQYEDSPLYCENGTVTGRLDVAFVVDTSASFIGEFTTLENKHQQIVDTLGENFSVNSKVYALDPTYTGMACKKKVTRTDDLGNCNVTDVTQCGSPRCASHEYFSVEQYSVIHDYADSINCTRCGDVRTPSGISKAPSEAWGVGASWMIDNYDWSNQSTKILFFIGDSLPSGGGRSNYDNYDLDIAQEVITKANEKNITLFGLHGNMEYQGTDKYGDPGKNDAKELMELVASQTGGQVIDYGGDLSTVITDIISSTREISTGCGPENNTGICQIGTLKCDRAGNWRCEGAVNPKRFERPNGKDDTCNGVIDDGCFLPFSQNEGRIPPGRVRGDLEREGMQFNASTLGPLFNRGRGPGSAVCEYSIDFFKHKRTDWLGHMSANPSVGMVSYENVFGDAAYFLMPNVSLDAEKEITIYENGVMTQKKQVNKTRIALHAHQLRYGKSESEAKQFIKDTAELMDQVNIIKRYDYDASRDTTTVHIEVSDIPSSSQKGFTIYESLEKDAVDHVSKITVNKISDGHGLILEKDPVIGWHFDSSGSQAEAEYEVEGNIQGGDSQVFAVQEPILKNEGNLIITYRKSCLSDEAALFELSSVEDSKIYPVGSGQPLSVCVGHATEEPIAGTAGRLDHHLFNLTGDLQVSYDNSYDAASKDISVDNTTPIFWEMQYGQENPEGNFSCLGSVNNQDASLFGDCGYAEGRIWLHLGADQIPPSTSLSYPYLAHTLQISLNASDNPKGSGVKKTYYCTDSEDTCTPNQEYDGSFSLTCPDRWGCEKFVRFYSVDNDGNQESVNSREISIIQEGSACQADCTVSPNPNRYVKGCRNLNGCEFYDYQGDDGVYVANQCDFLPKGSWTDLNSTHEVKCPNGPLRETTTTTAPFDFTYGDCENLINIPYSILYEGKPTTMHILVCDEEVSTTN